jgi:enoyl-CoA hydratase/carnithine racemase
MPFTLHCARRKPTPWSAPLADNPSCARNELDYWRNVENQIETLCNVFNTRDGREGLAAFLEKRTPNWYNAS